MLRHPLLFLLLGMFAAMIPATLIVMMVMSPPAEDIRLLVLFMSGSGLATVFTSYALYRQGAISRFASLRWTLVASIGITVLLVLINVWVTAQLMFISTHDFVLTIALLAFASLTALVFGLFVASAITGRIREMSRAAEMLAQGKLDARLVAEGKDELADFARTFNWMAESLQQIDREKRMIDQARRDLIAGVSHDLRTPLTSIRAMLEAIQDGVVSDSETIARYVQTSLSEAEHLNHLIDDLFELTKLDTGHLEMEFVEASLRDLISDVMSSMSVRAEQHQITLHADLKPDIDPVRMAPDKIQRVLQNLLDNAIRHTPAGGQITIRAYCRNDQVVVEVHNTGSSIDPIHLPHLFDTFYRVEQSRLRAEDGHRSTGLGLAIARGFVEAHQGTIQVESQAQPAYTTFRFAIPHFVLAS
jgi:signal transduction histidine kinase